MLPAPEAARGWVHRRSRFPFAAPFDLCCCFQAKSSSEMILGNRPVPGKNHMGNLWVGILATRLDGACIRGEPRQGAACTAGLHAGTVLRERPSRQNTVHPGDGGSSPGDSPVRQPEGSLRGAGWASCALDPPASSVLGICNLHLPR